MHGNPILQTTKFAIKRAKSEFKAALGSADLCEGRTALGSVEQGQGIRFQDLNDMTKKQYQIDGARFWSLDEFYEEISSVLIPGVDWGKNLDAFNDVLRGGFGTPKDGFILQWRNSEVF